MNRVVLILGSNIDKEWNLPRAVRLLSERTELLAVSSVYETAPVGTTDQPLFFNAAALVETPLNAADLKQTVLSDIEQILKRVRTEDKNAPRTIDLDIVLFNDEVFAFNGRAVPDPDLQKFLHVAAPVAELLPDGVHPESGEKLADLVARLVVEAANSGPLPIWKRHDFKLQATSAPTTAVVKAPRSRQTAVIGATAAASPQ